MIIVVQLLMIFLFGVITGFVINYGYDLFQFKKNIDFIYIKQAVRLIFKALLTVEIILLSVLVICRTIF